MENAIHLLLAVALVACLERPTAPTPYLVAVAAVSVPMVDAYTFTPLVERGVLAGPVWVHRSVSHSLLVGVLVVVAAATVGCWRAGALGYLAHLVPDAVLGGVRPLLPFDATVVGVYVDAWPSHYLAMEGAVALGSGLVVLAEIYRQAGGIDPDALAWIQRQREGVTARYPAIRDRSD